MIVKKQWNSKKGIGLFWTPVYTYTGYFLFGVIPLYISRVSN